LLKDEWADIAALTPNCTDLNSQGLLLVDAAMKAQGKEGGDVAYTLRRYNMKGHAQTDALEGEKEKVRFFKDQQIVELKQLKNGSKQLSVFDFANKLTVFWQSFSKVLFVEVEDDAIYVLVEVPAPGAKGPNPPGVKQLFKLYEMEDNVKIQTLLKKGLFAEA